MKSFRIPQSRKLLLFPHLKPWNFPRHPKYSQRTKPQCPQVIHSMARYNKRPIGYNAHLWFLYLKDHISYIPIFFLPRVMTPPPPGPIGPITWIHTTYRYHTSLSIWWDKIRFIETDLESLRAHTWRVRYITTYYIYFLFWRRFCFRIVHNIHVLCKICFPI